MTKCMTTTTTLGTCAPMVWNKGFTGQQTECLNAEKAITPHGAHQWAKEFIMSYETVGGTHNSQKKAETDLVELKGRVPLGLRRKVKSRAAETGQTMAEAMIELLTKGLNPELTDDVVLGGLLRKHLSPAQYDALDALRVTKRLNWPAVIRHLTERHSTAASGQPTIIPRPSFSPPTPPPRPTAREGYLPGTTVQDVTSNAASDTESGVRQVPLKKEHG